MEASIAHAPAHTPTLGVEIARELVARGALTRPGADVLLARIIDTAEAMGWPHAYRLADRLGVSYSTLRRRCEAAGLPGPARLILIGRLVRAVRIIRRGATCTAAALATGWPDVFTFSRAMYRECRMRPSTFRHDPRAEWHHLLRGWIACHRGDIAIGPAGYTRREALRIALHSAFAALMATPEPGRMIDLTTHSLAREAAARLRPFVGRV
ncbi:MAG TPA: helix-turn-helix domain-containing protein [Geminicoccaceae bacterium]|nr:helix-turn-helix domain-containing protein [Geminicoccaceae bacterium]